MSVWGDLNENTKANLALTVKVLGIEIGDNIDEILKVAKASNKQNAIKESDLFANEPEQRDLEQKALYLPEAIRYTYISKRTIQYPDESKVITRDEATLLLSLFINQNPSDRLEGLYKSHYKSIFEDIKPEYIPIIRLIRLKIEERYQKQDNNTTEKFWSEKAYKRFKKKNTLNFSLYLFSILLADKGYHNKSSRKELLDKIYKKMQRINNFDISSYFNNAFWLALQNSCLKFLRIKYEDHNTTSDELRKEVNKEDFMREYNNYCADKASEGEFLPAINIE